MDLLAITLVILETLVVAILFVYYEGRLRKLKKNQAYFERILVPFIQDTIARREEAEKTAAEIREARLARRPPENEPDKTNAELNLAQTMKDIADQTAVKKTLLQDAKKRPRKKP